MTSDPPLETIAKMRDALWDIRAVLGQAATEPEARRRAALRFGTTSRRHHILRRAAEEARTAADAAVRSRCAAASDVFGAEGLPVEVYARAKTKDSGFVWPDVEYAVLMHVDSLADWLTSESRFVGAAQALDIPLSFGAVIGGWLAPIGMCRVRETVFPAPNFGDGWAGDLPYPLLTDEDFRLYSETYDAIGTLSLVFTDQDRALNEEEAAFFLGRLQICETNMNTLAQRLEANPEDEVLAAATTSLTRAFNRFKGEVEQTNDGPSLATEATALLDGEASEATLEILIVRLGLLERAAWRTRPPESNQIGHHVAHRP